MNDLRLLIIPGSARTGSLNRKLAACAAELARKAGLQPSDIDLRQLDLPVYDGDIESSSGVPAGASRLQQAIQQADAVLLVTPEYNGFPTPLVINAFDWLSRIPSVNGHPTGLAVTANKPVALLSASPGAAGGLRSINFLRQYLQMNFAMLVSPQQFSLGKANEAFDDAGALKDPKAAQSVQGVLEALARVARALKREAGESGGKAG